MLCTTWGRTLENNKIHTQSWKQGNKFNMDISLPLFREQTVQ